MRKLATCAFSFSAAAAVAVFVTDVGWLLYAALALSVLACIFAAIKKDWAKRIALILISAAVGLGWTRGYYQLFRQSGEALDGQTVRAACTAVEYSSQYDYGNRTVVKLSYGGRYYKTMLYFTEAVSLSPGDTVSVDADISMADAIWGEETLLYAAQGIVLKAYAHGQPNIYRPEKISLRYFPALVARRFSKVIDNINSPDNAAFMKALILGDTTGLSDSFYRQIERSGLQHIFVVSGMHIGFLISLISLLARRRRLTATIGVPLLVFFAAMVGFTPSVVRSVFMYTLVLVAPLFRRESDGVTNLSLALLVLLAVNPYAIAGASLQLSFAAAGGITVFSPAIYKLFCEKFFSMRKSRIFRFAAASLSSSLGVMVLSTPVLAISYHCFCPISPLSNLLTIWAFSLTFIIGVISVLLGVIFLPAGAVAAMGAKPFMWFIRLAVSLFSKIPFAVISTDLPFVDVWLVYVYLVIIFSFVFKSKRPYVQLGCSAAVFAVLLFVVNGYNCSAGLVFTTVDVGQGQCLVASSKGQTVVIDCGGNKTPDAALYSQLDSQTEDEIDVLILTHFHDDHAEFVPSVIRSIPVKKVIMPDISDDTGNRAAITEAAGECGTEIVFLDDDARLDFGCCTAAIFAPVGEEGQNEQCLSLVISLDEYDIVVTGDMDSGNEALLAELHALPDCEAIVVGHHGSKNSTGEEFLDAVRPESAIISVGANSYGHPADDTLERLSDYCFIISRTDDSGSITIRR